MYIVKKTEAREYGHCSSCCNYVWFQVFSYSDRGKTMKAVFCPRDSQMVLTDFLLDPNEEENK